LNREGVFSVYVVPSGLPPAVVDPIRVRDGETVVQDLTVPGRGVQIEGRVLDSAGSPIGRARLEIRFSGIDRDFFVTADSAGHYEIEGPSAPRVSLTVSARATGYAVGTTKARVTAQGVVDVVLPRPATVRIPLALEGIVPSAITLGLRKRAQGRTRVPFVRRPCETLSSDPRELECRGILPGYYDMFLDVPGDAPADLGSVRLSEESVVVLDTVVPTRGGTVTGRARTPADTPLVGYLVVVASTDQSAETDKEGRFATRDFPCGRQTLLLFRPASQGPVFAGDAVLDVRVGEMSSADIVVPR
jgi:hypothetical protein